MLLEMDSALQRNANNSQQGRNSLAPRLQSVTMRAHLHHAKGPLMGDIRIEPYEPGMKEAAARVLGRAFTTNPIHIAAIGPDCFAENEALFGVAFDIMRGPMRVALDGDRVVGFVHWVDSSGCQPSGMDKLRLLPMTIRHLGVRRAMRVFTWMAAWADCDPRDPHVHLGPIGVDPDMQGRGAGRLLMEAYCSEVDRAGGTGYLETDRPGNVQFYRQFGFEVTLEREVIGVPNFFMIRPPRSAA
jgi:GNAT superfamily N-acetyltransferase